MASKYIISNINLNGNQIENAKFEVLSSAPANPVTGRMYYDSTKNKVGYYNGSNWRYLGLTEVTAGTQISSKSVLQRSLGLPSTVSVIFDYKSNQSTSGYTFQGYLDDEESIEVWKNDNYYKILSDLIIYAPTDCSWTFALCRNFINIEFNNFDTSNTIDMSGFFNGCSSLTSLDISKFNMSNVTNVSTMFYNCTNLSTIYASDEFSLNDSVTDDDMFDSCTSLVGGNGTTYDSSHTDKSYARIDASGTPGYFTGIDVTPLNANKVVVTDSNSELMASSITVDKLGYLSDVTSNIQSQLNSKQDTITGGATTITSSNLTSNRALVSNSSGKVAVSSVTPTELGYVSGVTSSIQTQLNSKQGTLTFDDTPTSSSNNPVKSGGIDSAIKNSQRVFYAVTETAGATAVKEFTINDFPTETVNGVKTPLKGTILIAQCTNEDARTAQLKFKVNDGGEFPIWYNTAEYVGTTAHGDYFGATTRVYTYIFNGTHWCWLSIGFDNNTTYTAGTGLKLSSNQFSLYVPRVTKSANSIPGKNTAIIEEYPYGTSDIPSNYYYHIITMQGSDGQSAYATQLALGMTTSEAYYRNYYNSVWQPWKRLDNPTMDSTPTAGNTSNVVSSDGIKTYVDTQVATKSNVIFRQWVTQ